MEKIKVAVIGAGGKMGTRTSNNLVTKFPDKFDVKLVETFPPAVERIEKERGLKVTPVDEALAFADVVIFAGGISPLLEGESMRVSDPGFKGGDRT